MTSKVDICNVGLSTYLGAGTINSLSEGTPEAIQCNLHYDRLLKSLLMRHWWTFAAGYQVLAEQANDRSTEWDYKYARPADALTIRWVNQAATARSLLALNQSPDTPREVVGQSIYSDVATATCCFTKVIDDPALYPQDFADALSAHIAAATAMGITQNGRLAREAMQAATYLTDVAIAHDAREEPPIDYAQTPGWLTARGVQ